MRLALGLEFLLLFVAMPAMLALWPLRGWPIPLLWAVALYGYLILARQPQFSARKLWGSAAVARQARSVLTLFLPFAAALGLCVSWLAPDLFLSLPRRRTPLWLAVMVLYPLLSVIPQTLVYRAFIFYRYGPLLGDPRLLILASGAAFAWVHIVLRNPLAPLLTLPGGLLFAWRYWRTGSVLASAFEHALYGCLMFTVGLGTYFYTGAVR